ncbi:hypothetical protein DB88DRAFT_497772 [Papiliotrema laurentii]|uniref:Transcription initiation factor IIE subunit beta n=1 Tax=Papiliotrema laurentii TaxID=5418 RepID=A0AAD9FMQ5_PAPLA|nr:hypothetical protein DB88DRAFT_497772 [Papiliotrema laurentii]
MNTLPPRPAFPPSTSSGLGKRKLPESSNVKTEPGTPGNYGKVKTEEGADVKRQKSGPVKVLSASHGAFRDVRTSAASVVTHLKNVGTLGYQDAWFHVEMEHPGHDPERVLAILKGLDKVEFNEINQVFSYVPDLKFKDEKELRNYIRTHATTLKPIYIKDIREALPPNGMAMLEALERMGEIMIMKALSGSFKEIALPPLGEKNTQGLGINDLGSSGYQRYKSLWWDDTRERGRAGKRLSQEFVSAWDKVEIKPEDDVTKLLDRINVTASSAIPPPAKIIVSQPKSKKPKKRAGLKITNTHMKSLGIDFSRDYEAPE